MVFIPVLSICTVVLGVKIHDYPRLDSPNMLAALPDMGNVAGIGISYIIKKLNAKLFAEIYSYWPPFVSYKNGIIDYKQSSYKFHYLDNENLLIFSGEFNPTDPRRLYEICYEVIRMAERMNVKCLYSIGAALRPPSAVESKVLGAVNNQQLLDDVKKHGIIMLDDEGQITGFNGLILGIAKERGVDAMCILGEIDNPNIIQPKAAQSILKVLLNMLGIKAFNMTDLDEEDRRKQFMEEQMSYLEHVMDRGEPPGIA
ncbi:MAG: PAC2 family protein [Nitrososphaerales archaeon]